MIEEPKFKAKEAVKVLPQDFFDGQKESSKVIYVGKALTWVH